MFIIERTTERAVPYEKTVHHHRAPTDDSIRIYEEVKDKAYKSIVDSFTIKDTKLECTATIFKQMTSFAYLVYWKAIFNGEPIEGNFEIDEYFNSEPKWEYRRLVMTKVFEKMSEDIAHKMMENMLSNMEGVDF